jgi:hypothetical protein
MILTWRKAFVCGRFGAAKFVFEIETDSVRVLMLNSSGKLKIMLREVKKTKRIAVGFLIVLSLFVSSVAACVCSHHAEKVETEVSSCHEHSEAAQETASPEKVSELDSNDDCHCIQPAPRVFSKSETIKFEKQTTILLLSQVEIKAISQIVSGASIYFEKTFYLSDSFYNLKSPRAPPSA